MRQGSMLSPAGLLARPVLPGVHEHPHATADNMRMRKLGPQEASREPTGATMSGNTDLELRRRCVLGSPVLGFSLLLFVKKISARKMSCSASPA